MTRFGSWKLASRLLLEEIYPTCSRLKTQELLTNQRKSMAAILGSAVASEAVSRISSSIILSAGGDARRHESEEERAERLEMAVVKIQAVAAVSEGWEVAHHQPLLRWKATLKRVGEEGDGVLRAHRKRIAAAADAGRGRDDDEEEDSIPRRIARAARRFVPFARGRGGDKDDRLGDEVLRRFERVAAGADEFLRYVQLGGRPRSLTTTTLLEIPAGSLLAGRAFEVSHRKGSLDALMLLQPWGGGGEAGGRKVAVLFLSHDDAVFWEQNISMFVVFELPGSGSGSDHRRRHIDIVGMVAASSQLLPPQFAAAGETFERTAREMLSQESGCCFSDASAMSAWCGDTARACHRYSTGDGEPSTDDRPGRCSDSSKQLQLPSPIIRVDAVCFCRSPATASCSLPLKLRCHITPDLVPDKYSHRYRQIDPRRLQELSDASLGSDEHWWCPRSCTYMAAERISAPPPSLKQWYAMENSDTRGADPRC